MSRREAHLGPSRDRSVTRYRLESALRELDAALATVPPIGVRASLQTARTHIIEAADSLRTRVPGERGPFG